MKRILLFTLLISFIGYSQNPIQPNHPSFKDGLPQGLVEKMNSMNLDFEDDEMDFYPSQKFNVKETQSFQSQMMVQNENEVHYHLDSLVTIKFGENILLRRETFHYDIEERQIYNEVQNWNTDLNIFDEGSENRYVYFGDVRKNTFFKYNNQKQEFNYDTDGNLTLELSYYRENETQPFVPQNKYENTYDENGNRTLRIDYNWDTNTQSFVPFDKKESTYDENGNEIQQMYFMWDTNTQSFILDNKSEFSYDFNGNKTFEISYSWDTNSQLFVPVYKRLNSFNVNNREIQDLYFSWDLETQSIVPQTKSESFFDNNGNQLYTLNSTWNSEFEIYTQTNKTYFDHDEQNRIVSQNSYSIDFCSGTKRLTNKVDYFYIDGSNNRGTIRYMVDEGTGEYVFDWSNGFFYNEEGKLIKRTQDLNFDIYQNFSDSYRWYHDYFYDENGNLTLHSSFQWDSNIQDYRNSWKSEYTYDDNGNQTLKESFNWDTNTQIFVPTMKDVKTYDYSFHPRYITQWKIDKYHNGIGYKPSFVKDYSIHSETDTELVIVGITKQYDTNFNTWNELEGEEFKSYWYYTKTPSLSTNSVESNSFSIYPNPTSNSLHINSSESLSNPIFELYDVKGSKILSNPFKLKEPIDVSDLQPSMYIYNVKDGGELKQSGKVLIE